MPWPSGKEFAEKHNKKLKGKAAQKAADQATAILKKTGNEGLAIATANKNAKKKPKEYDKLYNKD